MRTRNILIKDGQGRKLVLFDQDIEVYVEDDIYNEEMAEDFNENDEITTAEEGFMIGYLAA